MNQWLVFCYVYCYTLKRKDKGMTLVQKNVCPEQALNQQHQPFLAELKCNRHFSLDAPKRPITTFADRSVYGLVILFLLGLTPVVISRNLGKVVFLASFVEMQLESSIIIR